jgi:putative ABC transport system substrate-binding protein
MPARAQQPAMPVIGVLSSSSISDKANAPLLGPGLQAAGYVEGRNVSIEYHWADGQYDRLPAMALDLVRRQVTLIYTALAPATLAAKAATTTIPIVFAIGGDPVQGIIASMIRPGGNLTGVTFYAGELGPKRLELLRELVPHDRTIAFLANPDNSAAETEIRQIQAAAQSVGQRIMTLKARTADEIDAAFGTAAREQVGGLLVNPDGVFSALHEQLVALSVRYAIPAIYYNREFARAGGLMIYADDRSTLLHQAGVYVGRILKGEKPAELPVQRPTKFDLIINLKAARALGVTVPPLLLSRADEVLE